MIAHSLESLGYLVGFDSLVCFGSYGHVTPVLFSTFSL